MTGPDAGREGAAPAEQPASGRDEAAPSDPLAPALDGARARFSELADAQLSGGSILAAAGGWRGIVESTIPGLLFLIVYTFTKDLWLSIAAPAAVGLIGLVIRLVRREQLMPAIGGLLALALSAFLALRSGNDADFFLPGFWTNGAYCVVMLVSALAGWPLIGVVAGLLTQTGTAWRRLPRLRRLMLGLTLAWAAFFALRLAVQLPLYFAGNIEALGATKLLMGTPMYAVLLVLTVILARGGMLKDGLIGPGAPTPGERPAGQPSK
ncbi:hypothetical protein USB125703_01735 [Pseudoclavibacter triregionum]|nr:hypothetical protein USB125703_01735 [Pseudoclavibacter triregionum]